MTIDWTEVQKATNAEMVAGTLIARIGGEHVELGRKKGLVFSYTERGEEIARGLVAVRDARGDDSKPGRKRRGKKQAEAPAEDETDDDGLDELNQLRLDLADDVSIEDVLD